MCDIPIPVNNRFNVLSHIDTIETDQSHVLKNSNDENVDQSLCQNTGSHTTKHTKEILKNTFGECKENKHIRYCNSYGSSTEKQLSKDVTRGKHRNEATLIETVQNIDIKLVKLNM